MKFSTIDIGDIEQAVELAKSIFKENMAEQFVRLYSPANANHIFVAKNDLNEICSLLCYYPSSVHIYDSQVTVGSIGSVCTKQEYRGQGLASTLLEMSYQVMEQENISLAIISGAGGIYQASGAIKAGSIHRYHIKENQIPRPVEELTCRLARATDYPQMAQIHESEPVRFARTYEEFLDLYSSQTYPDDSQTYPVYVVARNDQITGYYVCCNHLKKQNLDIREYAGNRTDLSLCMKQLLLYENKDIITWSIPNKDSFIELFAPYESSIVDQDASLRIINPNLLWNQLKPILHSEVEVFYDEVHQTSILVVDSQSIQINGTTEMIQYVFGKRNQNRMPIDYDIGVPIPFPWTHGLNYQ